MPSAALAWAGGPSGQYARSEWLLGLGPLAVVALLPVVTAVLRLQYCLANGWSGSKPFYRMCYSDLANSVQVTDLGKGLTAYVSGDLRLEQPPLSGAVMSFVGGLVGSGTGGSVLSAQRWFIAFWAVLGVGLIVLMIAVARTIADHPGANPAMIALAPVVALTLLLSPDIVGVALATVGMWAWTKRRPGLAGVVIGLGALARTYPVLVLAVIALFALRADDGTSGPHRGSGRPQRRGDLVWTFSTFVGTVVLGLLPFLAQGETVSRLVRSWWRAPSGLGSLMHAPTLGGAALPGQVASVLAIAGWVAALVIGGYFVTGARRPPTLAAAVLVVVAIVIVTGKSYPVQGALWLVPLVALAGLRWRDVLLWSAAEGAHFVALWLYVGGLSTPTRGLPAGWYLVFVMLRLAAVLWLARQAWVDAPRRQPSDRRGAGSDPEGSGRNWG